MAYKRDKIEREIPFYVNYQYPDAAGSVQNRQAVISAPNAEKAADEIRRRIRKLGRIPTFRITTVVPWENLTSL